MWKTQGHIWLTLNKCISLLQTMESMDIQACSSVRAPGMGTVPLQMHQFKATWIAQNGKAFHTVGVETASRWTSARGFSPILIHDNSIAVVFCLKIRARPLVTYGMSTNQCDLMLPGSEASIDLNTQWYFRIKAQIATPRPHLPPTDFRLSSEWPALRSSYASPASSFICSKHATVWRSLSCSVQGLPQWGSVREKQPASAVFWPWAIQTKHQHIILARY